MNDDHHSWPDENRIHCLEDQEVIVRDFACDGLVLDIGGGGEGVIGRLKGREVIAIDNRRKELEEAPDGPIKVVADAASLPFLDNTFPTTTAFFTFMFMDEKTHPQVMAEVFRTLREGGQFLLWDIHSPIREGSNKDIFAFKILIRLPHETITPAYGGRRPNKVHDLNYYRRLVSAAGLRFVRAEETGLTFFIQFEKPYTG
ncbi:MAG: methyltransferase domain-containing protein [candidate division Zixibacteria bacterium]|nr:methyltransferase domain-containing protein [candidate division Zixibacteria bacterium]